MSFSSFSLHPDITAGVAAAGFVEPTPIQARAIPPVLEGRDVMGLAQTGTGKTAAFALPILQRLRKGPRKTVRALVLAPTRELAEQIHQAIGELGGRTGVRSLAAYGGTSIHQQVQRLRSGVEVLVACPGRLLDLIERRAVDLGSLEVLVLDEADRMFDMGFLPSIRRILRHVPRERQTLLFSATMPDDVSRLARQILRDPVTVRIGESAPANTIRHGMYPVEHHQKTPLLLELLRRIDTGSVLVFARTRHRVNRLCRSLQKAGHPATSLQGDLSQGQRDRALRGFREGKFRILVATDIAARGIDVSRIEHVVNFDMPDTPDGYTHRVGRTGRATRAGDAHTLVSSDDHGMVRSLERILETEIDCRRLEGFDYAPASPDRLPRRAVTPGRRKGALRTSVRPRRRARAAW